MHSNVINNREEIYRTSLKCLNTKIPSQLAGETVSLLYIDFSKIAGGRVHSQDKVGDGVPPPRQ